MGTRLGCSLHTDSVLLEAAALLNAVRRDTDLVGRGSLEELDVSFGNLPFLSKDVMVVHNGNTITGQQGSILKATHHSSAGGKVSVGGISNLDVDHVLVGRHNDGFLGTSLNLEGVLLLVVNLMGDRVLSSHGEGCLSSINTVDHIVAPGCNLEDIFTNLDGGSLNVAVLISLLSADMNVKAKTIRETWGRKEDKVTVPMKRCKKVSLQTRPAYQNHITFCTDNFPLPNSVEIKPLVAPAEELWQGKIYVSTNLLR